MRRLLFYLVFFASVSATAQDFQILAVNTETIRIGNKNLKSGDVFNNTETIHWSNDRQAMKVLSLPDKKHFIFTSPDFKQNKAVSARDYLVQTHRLSTRGSGSLSTVARKIGERIYVIDETLVPIDYQPFESEYFFLSRNGRRDELPYRDRHLVFHPGIWSDGPEGIVADLYFHHADGTEEIVREGIAIIPLPKELAEKKCCGKKSKKH